MDITVFNIDHNNQNVSWSSYYTDFWRVMWPWSSGWDWPVSPGSSASLSAPSRRVEMQMISSYQLRLRDTVIYASLPIQWPDPPLSSPHSLFHGFLFDWKQMRQITCGERFTRCGSGALASQHNNILWITQRPTWGFSSRTIRPLVLCAHCARLSPVSRGVRGQGWICRRGGRIETHWSVTLYQALKRVELHLIWCSFVTYYFSERDSVRNRGTKERKKSWFWASHVRILSYFKEIK